MRLAIIAFVPAAIAVPAFAEDVPSYPIEIKAHSFAPASLTVPAGVRVTSDDVAAALARRRAGLLTEWSNRFWIGERRMPFG